MAFYCQMETGLVYRVSQKQEGKEKMIGYILGLLGLWYLTDGLISIRLYLNSKDETGKRLQNWKYDHSIRVIRSLGGIALMVMGWMVMEGK